VSDGLFFALWLALFVAGIAALLRTKRELANLTVILTVGAAVLTLPQVAKIATYRANHPSVSASDPRLWPTALHEPVVPSGARLPDIYVLIPDDYARADVLKQYFHYDDSGFIRQLEKRGFAVSDQARSPYADSESNIAAMLNLDYLSAFPSVLGKKSQDVRPVKRVMQDNRASRLLKSLGYRYVHIDTDDVTFAGDNPNISSLGCGRASCGGSEDRWASTRRRQTSDFGRASARSSPSLPLCHQRPVRSSSCSTRCSRMIRTSSARRASRSRSPVTRTKALLRRRAGRTTCGSFSS
jgi:hypothetical protein